MNRDKYGIIGQVQPEGWIEGGDSVCWMGHWLYLNGGVDPEGKTVTNVDSFIKFFEVSFGAYVRHPDPEMTYNGFGAHYANPWNGCITRDQLTGILAALVVGKKYTAMLRLIVHHMAWLMLFSYANIKNGRDPKIAPWKLGDPTVFDIWATQIRGLGPVAWLLWPLLCILDLHILISTVWTNYEPDTENDVINHTAKLMIAKEHKPTPLSWLAWKLCDKKGLLRKLKLYWAGWRANPEYVELYEKKFKLL